MPIGEKYEWFRYGICRLSEYNQCEPVRQTMPNLPERFFVRDITLKGGASHEPGAFLDVDGVFKIVEELAEAGVTEYDCGRVYLKRDMEVMKRVKEAGFKIKLCPSIGEVDVPGVTLDRNHYHKYIDLAFEHGADNIKILWESGNIKAPPWRPKEHMLRGIPVVLDAIEYVHSQYKTDVSISTADNTRTDMEFQLYFHRILADAGIDRIWISDEGNANPSAFRYVVQQFRKVCKDIPFVFHIHNTWGMGNANIMAGVEAAGPAPVWADLSVNGLGDAEPLDEIVLALEFLYGIDTGIKLDKLLKLSKVTEEVTGITPYWHKPHTGMTRMVDWAGLGYMKETAIELGSDAPLEVPHDPVATTFNCEVYGAPNPKKWKKGWWGEIGMIEMKKALESLGLRARDADAKKMIELVQKECRKKIKVEAYKQFVWQEEFVELAKKSIPKK